MSLLDIGTPAPAFTLMNADGNPISLKDHLGKWVVIYFYPKAMTPGCTIQACGLRDSYAELAKHDAVVLGISPDEPTLLKKFVHNEHLNFTLLSDSTHATAELYGVWQQKSMYGKTYMGVARSTYVISPSGHVAQVWPNVKPETHAQAILDWFEHKPSEL